jgi:uncharacterized protein involved in response to NO
VSDPPARTDWVPFAYGFRPFFLAAIAWALVAIVAWTVVRAVGAMPLPHLPPQLWHGHEMLFGFFTAAIAGFLLTAVPGWTATRVFAGWPLALLTLLWLLGRTAFAFANALPSWFVALAELPFLPALAGMVAVPLLRARNRNMPLLLVLVALWLVDATFVYAMTLGKLPLASSMLRVGLDIVLLLITVIGGRVVPSFTAGALRRRGIEAPIRSHVAVEAITITAMVAVVAVDLIAPAHSVAAIVAAVAALAHLIRLSGWRGTLTLGEPIVWVLHLAYLWLPVGLALKAVSLMTGTDWAAGWLHALTTGAASMMVVAVITRASLGHTGRELTVSLAVAISYAVLGAAAVARVAATALGSLQEWALGLAAVLWTIAFAILLFTYGPILLRRRVDGREG